MDATDHLGGRSGMRMGEEEEKLGYPRWVALISEQPQGPL